MKIKQIKNHLGCILDEKMSEETMALPNINKINNKIKCLYHRNIVLTLRQLLLSSTNSTAFSLCLLIKKVKLIKKLKNRIQISQNKCICFCQHLDKMTHTSHKELETLNLLPMTERFNQCINLIVFEYVNDQWPNYLHKVSQTAPENNFQTRESFQKLKCPFHKTNVSFG